MSKTIKAMMGMRHWLGVLTVMCCLTVVAPAYAQGTPAAGGAASAEQNCTDFEAAKRQMYSNTSGEGGLLSEIYTFIKGVVGDATQRLFSAFTENDAYQAAVGAAMVLMVTFFGVAFTIGVVQVSFQQVLIRLVKLGIVASVISPMGWYFFSDTAVKFFMEGTDDLIKGVVAIGTGVTPPPNATPFYQFDQLAGYLIQPETFMAIIGALFSGGPYGLMVGGLMGIAIWGFVSLLINALKNYAVMFVGRSLLLGVGPIFVVFLLFDRTKQLFMSWVQALLSMSLQPILMFTFLSFFMLLIESAGKDMLSADLCWTEFSAVQGTSSQVSFWRFKDPSTGELLTSQMTANGAIQCLIGGKGDSGKGDGAGSQQCAEFPVNIIDVLSFLVLVYIAQRFGGVIERIANELSNTFISLDQGSKIDEFMKKAGAATGTARR